MTLRETVFVAGGRLPLWPLHRERLAEGGVGCEALRALDRAVAEVFADVTATPSEAIDSHVSGRLQAIVGPAGECTVRLDSAPSSLDVPGGPTVAPVTVDRLPRLPPSAAKPADRSFWDGPLRLARLRGADLAILVSPGRGVLDCATATVWAVLGGVLVTPPAPPAVAGVARRAVLQLARECGIPAEVRPLAWSEFVSAEEALLTNAVGGVVPVRDRGGPVASAVAGAFSALLEV